MDGGDLPLVLVLAGCLVAAVVLAGAETSLIRVPRIRVETRAEEGSRTARRLLGLLQDLPLALNAILLAVLLVQLGAATVTGLLADRWFGNTGVTVATVILTVVMFVYTEAIPKTFAYHHPLRVAGAVSLPVTVLVAVLRPLVRALVWIADLHAPGSGITTGPTVTEQELRRLAEEAASEGQITDVDRALIERAFKLGDRNAREVMVPRPDVVTVDVSATLDEARDTALAAGHRRLVVTDGDLDRVAGVVALRDIIAAASREPPPAVADLLRPPLVASEWTRVLDLLENMQRRGTHLAIVIDEHGSTSGIVTIEDIVEELLGTVADEGKPPEPGLHRIPGAGYLVDGSMLVDDLGEALDVDLPAGDWTTVGGMVMGLTGAVPEVGTTADAAGHRFRVAAMAGRRIRRVAVTPIPEEPPRAEEP